jgi:hypothetical protein
MSTIPTTTTTIAENRLNNERLSWYWWIKGRYLSDLPPDFVPTSNDTLEQIAWSSIKYDHLGGPNTQHVLLTHLKPGELCNPNRAWDMSLSVHHIMQRIMNFENILNLITVLMHVLVIFPLTSTYLQTQRTSGGNLYGTVQLLIQRLLKWKNKSLYSK